MSTIPAGWYPDPEREGATRWWDGTQWAPSQEPVEGAVDAAATGESSWSTTPHEGAGSAWERPDASSHDPQQQSAPAWQQQPMPTWQPEAQPPYGAQQDFAKTGTQHWNQYDAQPKRRRTGLIVGIVVGALVLVALLVGGGIVLITNVIGNISAIQSQTHGGDTEGGGTQSGGTQGGSTQGTQVTVAADEQSVTRFEIETAGTYEISVQSLNGGDPTIEVTGNGLSWQDDDGGEGTDSLLAERLEPGTYTLVIEEFWGEELTASVSITQR